MYVFACVCVRVCVHVRMCACACTSVCACARVRVRVSYAFVWMCVCVPRIKNSKQIWAEMSARTGVEQSCLNYFLAGSLVNACCSSVQITAP
jgi:hypothetical protein